MGGPGGGPRRGARRYTRAVRSAGRLLDNSESQTGLPYLETTSEASGTLAALPHRAQSSVRVNASRESLSHAQAGAFFPFARLSSVASEQWRPSPYSP